MRLFVWCMTVLVLFACGSYGLDDGQTYSSDNCTGVDTSQAPFRIQRVNYPDGHYSETWYYPNYCSITYYY